MSACLSCLEPTEGDYHPACLDALFGSRAPPQIDAEVAKLHTLALAMVGRTSISGVQRKISLRLSSDRETLQVAMGRSQYILKPRGEAFPALPENEHVTMRIAARAGLEVAPCALVRLKDGTLAYLTARFDRLPSGRKLRQEDFCQLACKPPKDKYDGSAELCARIVGRFASEPLIDMARLYRLLAIAWWTGNGDMHLKNFSLLAGEDGLWRMSPAYDLVCTRLVIPDDVLALPVAGKHDKLRRGTWRKLATYCGLRESAAKRILRGVAASVDDACRLVDRSLLPAEMKQQYTLLLRERATDLV
jgi:serine/threonine-protein kinase HipA